jgi:carboxyl-terminal processing protease
MKPFRFLGLQMLAVLTIVSVGLTAIEPDAGQIAISVGKLLEQGHYTRRKLDDTLSREFLKNYLERLDYNHLFFTQGDVKAFEDRYATSLDEEILLGNPEAAYEIFKVYRERVEQRVAKVKELLKQDWKFDSKRSVEINRQKAPWPKDEADADRLWKDRIEGELLQEKLATHPIDPPIKVITRRYDQVLRSLHEQTNDDVINTFLSVVAETYDPHSEYMSKSELENFTINMKLSLVGIGAVLQSDEGYAKIKDLVPGGPAEVDGRLKVNDRVAAVAQEGGEFVDVVDMKLDKVVEMIRGKKGTTVRLQVIPSTATDPSQRKVIEIVRDEIKLKDQEAKAEVIEQNGPGNIPQKLGWITLPSFYADMDHAGAKDAKSTTRDVRALIDRLKQENIGGLVIDLRRNGGGSLEEAVNLTGLFIKKGPVVQAKESSGRTTVSRDRDPSVAYDGPLVVLTSSLSASASEIFAAALQDYGRAVVVGDKNTFGKGTVQTMLEIGRVIPFLGTKSNEAGALKLTIQKFYRIAGGSTQLRGVQSDIKLPSPYDHEEIGESALKNPLPYDEVDPAPFEKLERALPLEDLRQRSAARVTANAEFRYISEDLARLKEKITRNKVSLNEKERRAELATEEARKERRKAERAKRQLPEQKVYELTLDNIGLPQLPLAKDEATRKKERAAATAPEQPAPEASPSPEVADAEEEEDPTLGKDGFDPIRAESLNILADLVELTRTGKTASRTK